jgi:hypothetical protein
MNSTWGGLRPAVGLRRPGGGFASAEADAWRAAPWKADFHRRRGLRPAVGLRRPGGFFCVGGGRRPARQRLGRPISIGAKAFGRWLACTPNEFGLQRPSADGRPAPTGRYLLRRRRPTPGAQRLGGPISIGAKAFGRWLACTPNEFGLQRPSAGGRPAPTGRGFCVGGGRRLARSAWEGRFQSAQKPSADGWPAPTGRGFCVGGGRRPARQRLEGPISIGVKAFDQWSACTSNEFDLGRPSAGGRPAPTGRGFCVGGGRRLARSALEGRFPSAQRPSAGGRPAPTGRFLLRRRRPTPGAPAPWKADFNRRKSLRPMVGLHAE